MTKEGELTDPAGKKLGSGSVETSWQVFLCRLRLIAKRVALAILLLFGTYVLICLVGLWPINSDFVQTLDGVEVHIVSNSVHADVVFPIQNGQKNWREIFGNECFEGDCKNANCIAIGWGDRAFFLDTPTWADLKISTAANAMLLPTETVMHVALTKIENYPPESCRRIMVSQDQYERMVRSALASFARDDNDQMIQIPDRSYGINDAFFKAKGSYHLFNTCNSWVGYVMRQSGVKTPLVTTMPMTPLWYLDPSPPDKED